MRTFDYKHILPQSGGGYIVKGYDTYPPHSVLAGQVRINFINRYATLKQAEHDHPSATMSHPMMEPVNSFNHLSNDNDIY